MAAPRDRGAHGGVRDGRRIGPFAAALHVGKLVAQGRDAALGELRRDRRHERMLHARAGAMREDVAGARLRRRLQQARDANAVVDSDGDRLGNMDDTKRSGSRMARPSIYLSGVKL